MNIDGPENTIAIRSKPDPLHTWIATITYQSDIHKINANRSPGGTIDYTLALTRDWNGIVALYGNSNDVDHGLTAESLGRNIMTFMLTG
jgi:hypothetical protein